MKDDPQLIEKFTSFIEDPGLCPKSVFIAFENARLQAQKKEPTPHTEEDYNNFTLRPDKETEDLVDLASTIFESFTDDQDSTDFKYDYGKEYDWSTKHVQVRQHCME